MDARGLKVSLANRNTFENPWGSPRFLCTKYIVGESEDAFYSQAYDHNFKAISFTKWRAPLTPKETENCINYEFGESPCEKYFLRTPTWDWFAKSLIKSEQPIVSCYRKLYNFLSSEIVPDVMAGIFIPLLNLIRLDYHNYEEIFV